MKVADFAFDLPDERIAQQPCEPRDASRLMVLDPAHATPLHLRFSDLPQRLARGDLLVLNDTRVVPARLYGRRSTGGRVELLLLERLRHDPSRELWRCWLRSSRKPRSGHSLAFDGSLSGRVQARDGEDWTVELLGGGADVTTLLDEVGRMPLPPYIRRPEPGASSAESLDELDRERYQTVYARRPGAVAAPTAGLHFTRRLLEELAARGIATTYLTLHVGPGTFRPVRAERVEDHALDEEVFDIPPEAAEALAGARARGGRVVAVGTTVVRALEQRARDAGAAAPGPGRCRIFIYPGFRFRVVDALVTNFHLPRSTLLMLVCAFAGRHRILAAYDEAIRQGYRFYSYGDAMLVGRDA